MGRINILEAIKEVEKSIPNFTDKLLSDLQSKIHDELKKRNKVSNLMKIETPEAQT